MPAAPHLATLHQVLDHSLGHAALYPLSGMALSNHLPMVLHALWDLGADEAVLARQLDEAAKRLVPASADELALAQPMAQALTDQGLTSVLQTHLPSLLATPETGAFHGMIRLAHAVEGRHPHELARALALWRHGAVSLGPVNPLTADHDAHAAPSLREVLAHALADPALAFTPRMGTTIVSDLQAVVALPDLARHVSGEAAPSDAALTTDAIAEASLAVYLASRDFTALHLVTGLHAWRTLTGLLPTNAPATPHMHRVLWRAWLAAWVSIGRPAPDWGAVHAGQARESDWQRALPGLYSSTNDHAIKLAWSARAEWRHRGWPGYARVLQAKESAA